MEIILIVTYVINCNCEYCIPVNSWFELVTLFLRTNYIVLYPSLNNFSIIIIIIIVGLTAVKCILPCPFWRVAYTIF